MRFGIGPTDGHIKPFEILTKLFLHDHGVSHHLHGVIQIALQVHDRDGGPLGQFRNVFVALIIKTATTGNGVTHAAQHNGGVLGCFAVGDLHLIGCEVLRTATELGDPATHGIARARALFKKQHEDGLVLQQGAHLAFFLPGLEIVCQSQQMIEFIL
ncbi:MAG: hypothetical protein ACD_62C00328G0002 [uncultured bacterium]|nr:MAG: hypothetical protein ACD_62C00328G0002 [uncultured bacterium]